MDFFSFLRRALLSSGAANRVPIRPKVVSEDDALRRGQQGFVPMNSDVRNFQMQPIGMAEDAGYIRVPQGFSPRNADIANFQMQPQGLPEDAGLIFAPQGFSPMSADIANFQNVRSSRGRNPMPKNRIPGNQMGYYQGGNGMFNAQSPTTSRLKVVNSAYGRMFR